MWDKAQWVRAGEQETIRSISVLGSVIQGVAGSGKPLLFEGVVLVPARE